MYVDLVLGLCVLMLVVSEHFRFISETAGRRGRKKKRGKKKSQKVTTAELEKLVRQMFPERPEPDERSRARAAVVKLLNASA